MSCCHFYRACFSCHNYIKQAFYNQSPKFDNIFLLSVSFRFHLIRHSVLAGTGTHFNWDIIILRKNIRKEVRVSDSSTAYTPSALIPSTKNFMVTLLSNIFKNVRKNRISDKLNKYGLFTISILHI